MSEDQAHAGNGPADLSAPTGPEDRQQDFIDKHAVPAVTRLTRALASCDAVIERYLERAVDSENYGNDAQTKFALAAGRLAAAQAHAAGAIARLADAETRQRLASAKMDVAALPPRRHTTASVNRAVRNNRNFESYDPKDWEDDEFEDENTTFNSSNDESGDEKTTFNSSGNPEPAFTGPSIRQL